MLPINIYLQYQYPFGGKQDLHKLHFKLLVSQLILNAVNCNGLFLCCVVLFLPVSWFLTLKRLTLAPL